MTERLKELLDRHNQQIISDRQLIGEIKRSTELQEEIIQLTSFLDSYDIYDIIERLYYVVNNLTEVVKCKYCNNKATWYKRGLKEGYREICSSKECRKKQLSETHSGNTKISENRNSEFIEWQNSVTEVNDDIIKQNITYDKFLTLITNPLLLDYLNTRYTDSDSLEETLKRIKLGIEEKPKCALPGCNNPVTFVGRQRAMFTKYCCPAHSAQAEETRKKCKQTNLEHWGTENVYDSSIYQQKVFDEYGVKYHWLREDIQEKRNMTCLERYGTIYPTQVKDIMDKVRQTTLERYGAECMFMTPEVYEHSHNEETIEKIRQTNKERYGCISPFGSDEVRQKISETNKERYGHECMFDVPWVREKAHSEESREKQKQTNRERYGYDTPLSSPEVREKIMQTEMDKYGYPCHLMTPENRKKSFEKMKENSQLQKSHKEDEVYEFIRSLGYRVERHHMTDEFPFNADMYLPDYNLYIEYQGSHFHNTYSFMGTKDDFKVLQTYYEKSQHLKEESGDEDKLTQYDNMIYVWSDLDVRKRVYAQENNVRYFEIYKQPKIEYIQYQLEFLLNCIERKRVFNIPEDILRKEFQHFKNIHVKELATTVGRHNSIVRHFQCTEFYKHEMEIFATCPNDRRKLIQNRCKYLNKKEWELTPNDLLTGFKKSGIYYGYSHFNPLWTNWFVNKYRIKTIYDPCGGWGHHMLGMLSCDKIIYNEINRVVSSNVQKMKDYFSIDNLYVHCGDARTYTPDDVDAFFMCPPYYNIEKYDDSFESLDEYKEFLKSIFDIWHKNNAQIFGIILREDLAELIDELYVESHEMIFETSHLTKNTGKKYKEYFYIFKK